jgi:tetratricopeptide (TPR) repeat protein
MLRTATYSTSPTNASIAHALLTLLGSDTTYLVPLDAGRLRALTLLYSWKVGSLPVLFNFGIDTSAVLLETFLDHLLRGGNYQAAFELCNRLPAQKQQQTAKLRRAVAESKHAMGQPVALDTFPEQGFFHAAAEADTARAIALFRSILAHYPSYGYGRSLFMRYLLQQGNAREAYEIGLTGIRIDPLSTPVQQAQAFACIALGLDTYATHCLETLERTQSPTDYNRFKAELEAQRALIQKSRDNW